ncbi:hypothetical protein MPSEU_000694500 [Mayamaea pseudoterrestris]|nr:hypothetical protein MPSEU_000694500 [Mayamaea pseudoterrestris]
MMLSLLRTYCWLTLLVAANAFHSANRFRSFTKHLAIDAFASKTTLHVATAPVAESSRLRKAKLLLEQLSENEDYQDLLETTATTTAATTSTTPSPAIILPDSVFFNGHLTASSSSSSSSSTGTKSSQNYVTRWARGVKVAEPLVKYDPIQAETLLFRQPTKWVVRNFQIALPIGWWAVGVVTDYVLGQRTQRHRQARAKQLRQAISDLGPAIIKGGQALASRPDLLPGEYLVELQKLQDDVPRYSNELAFQTVEQELGQPFESVFELLEDEPVAAASIGQVYKARLKANGDTVALKIQRPGCEEVIALDLYVLRWWSGVYNRIFELLNRSIDVQNIIDDFGTLIYREIDYVAEAANAQRFNELYAGVKDIFIPKIYSELTTSKVLTMEWVDGFRLTDVETLRRYGLDETKLVDILVQSSMQQILQNGFYHADPHAGNILACPDGRLCYLDFGMMSYVASHQRNGFLLAVVHIVNRDWPELVRLYQKLGFIPEGTELKPIEDALERAMPDVLNADITELNIKNIFNKLGDIFYKYPFSLPPFYIAIIRCLGVLEGLAIQVDPTAKIVSGAYPYVASRVLTDPQPELQEALRRLALNPDGTIRWGRLEGLLEEAQTSQGYDPSAALDVLSNYLLSPDSDNLIEDLLQQVVNAADSLGTESIRYVLDASRALIINDEVAAVRAFRNLQDIVEAARSENAVKAVRNKVGEDLRDVLPEPTPSMKRFWKIITLLSARNGQNDVANFIPVIRKLAQEPRIQRAANEIAAKLGERLLSRGLRAAFGLPPPTFGRSSQASTVTEDNV